MNKKALAASFIVGTLLTLISFVLISGTIQYFASQSEDLAAEHLCRDSILLRGQTALQVGDGFLDLKFVPPACQTLDKKVAGNKEAVLQNVANRMARCWWQFNEGRFEQVFDTFDAPILVGEDAENDCFMCYTLLVDDNANLGEDEKITPEEMFTYLQDTTYPKTGTTYLNYIQSYGGPGTIGILDQIEPGKAYGISFLSKNHEIDKLQTGYLGLAEAQAAFQIGTAAVGIIAGVTIIGVSCTLGLLTGPGEIPICAAATIAGGTIITGSFIALGVSVPLAFKAYRDLKATFYESERDTSKIIFDGLESSQQHCFNGDLSGT